MRKQTKMKDFMLPQTLKLKTLQFLNPHLLAEAALLKAQPSFPNVGQLNELLVKSLQTEFSKILSAHDFSSSLPTELKELPSKFNELTKELKGLKKQVHELEIKMLGNLKKISTKLEDFTKIVTVYKKAPLNLRGEHIKKDKGKKVISSEEAKKESTNSDSDNDDSHQTGSMVEPSRIKKKIEEYAKAKAAKRKSKVRKEELVDLLGPEVVNKYYNAKLQYDRYCDKMLNRRAESRITNCDDFVTIEDMKDFSNTMIYTVQEIFFRRHQDPGLDDHARTFSSILLAEIDKRNLNPLKQIRVIEQLRHLCSGTKTEEGICKELQFSLVDNSKLDDVYLLKRSRNEMFHFSKVYKAEKRLLYVKKNKAISLGKGVSKVGIEVSYSSSVDERRVRNKQCDIASANLDSCQEIVRIADNVLISSVSKSNDVELVMIRNLDDGKEFVVDEVREDGICRKVKEVDMGRRLIMEEFEMCVGPSPIVQDLKMEICVCEVVKTWKTCSHNQRNSGPKEPSVCKSLADKSEMSITGSNKSKLTRAKILLTVKFMITGLADESLVCSTLLPPLEKLTGAEPVSGPKTIKSILKSKFTFKTETLKGITINEPSSAPARGNKKFLQILKLTQFLLCNIKESLSLLNNDCSKHLSKDYLHKYGTYQDLKEWVNTFRNAIGAHYLAHSSEYVAPPSIDIITNKDDIILYSLANEINIDYASFFWEDIIKLNKRHREKVVPYTRFISLLMMHKMKECYGEGELTLYPTLVFSVNNWALKPNQPEEPLFTDHMLANCSATELNGMRCIPKAQSHGAEMMLQQFSKVEADPGKSTPNDFVPQQQELTTRSSTLQSQKHKLEFEKNKAEAEVFLLKAQPSFPNGWKTLNER
ncbi:zinc finger, CCHC-type containing protein [Tanacetum coccineum]